MKIKFKDSKHKEFYFSQIEKCRNWDKYHRALMYTLGLSADCREHITDLYNYKDSEIIIEGLEQAWITSGSRRVVLMAFNLFNGFMDGEESTPYSLFSDSNAAFFYQAIRLLEPQATEVEFYSVADENGQIVIDNITARFLAEAHCQAYERENGKTYTVIKQEEILAEISL